MQGNNNEKLIATFATPFQSLENMLQQLLTERSIDTAIGAQLDIIGKIVGQPRNGLSDDTYRRYCRARVATNNSNGTTESLISVADLIIYEDLAVYVIKQEGTATARLRVSGVTVTNALGSVLFSFIKDAKSGGVRIVVQWSEYSAANTFTLDIGPGLDVGHLANSLG